MSVPMEPQIIIARRIAGEIKAGMLVNLGIGIPTAVANYIPEGLHVFFQSENGLIGDRRSTPRRHGASRPRTPAADPSPRCPGLPHSIARCRSVSFEVDISTSRSWAASKSIRPDNSPIG